MQISMCHRLLFRLVTASALCVAVTAPLAGQVRVAVGDRIRVTVTDRKPARLVGQLVSSTADGLVLRSDGESHSLSVEVIRKLEVSNGKNRLGGMLIGVITGSLFGGFIGSSIERGTSDSCFDSCGLGGFILGFGVGALGGGVVGYSLLAGDRWQEIDTLSFRSLQVPSDPSPDSDLG